MQRRAHRTREQRPRKESPCTVAITATTHPQATSRAQHTLDNGRRSNSRYAMDKSE